METRGHTEHFICVPHQIPDGNFRENLSEKLFCFVFFSLFVVCLFSSFLFACCYDKRIGNPLCLLESTQAV